MTFEVRYWIARCVTLECERMEAKNIPVDIPAVFERIWNDSHCTMNPKPVLSDYDRKDILRMAEFFNF